MSQEKSSIEVLEAHRTGIADTHTNLAGLVGKLALIQAELGEGGHARFADALGDPFSALSNAAEKLKELMHDIEVECNRLRSEQ